jgi:hypothetical protein
MPFGCSPLIRRQPCESCGLTSFSQRCRTSVLHWHSGPECQVYVKKHSVSCSASAAIPLSVRPFGALKYLECPSRSADNKTSHPGHFLQPNIGRLQFVLRLTCQADPQTGKPSLLLFRSLVVAQLPIDLSVCEQSWSGTINSWARQRIPSSITTSSSPKASWTATRRDPACFSSGTPSFFPSRVSREIILARIAGKREAARTSSRPNHVRSPTPNS